MILPKDRQLETYRRMQCIRSFEEAAEKLLITGEVSGYCHSSIGHEASIVGACMALRDNDYITGSHRSHGYLIGKGAKLSGLMAELLGRETGICKGRGGSMHFADPSIGVISESAIVGGGIPLATGAGLSAQVRGTDQVSLCFFGDGAVNQGTFHESLNMASIWSLPVIYFCENNLYAFTTPLTDGHAQSNIAKRADGYGMPGVTVDGQDVEAVYEITCEAVRRSRSDLGPTLIEAKTYRFDGHYMNTSNERYRSQSEIDQYRNTRDPLILYKNILLERGISKLELARLEKEVAETVSAAVIFARKSSFPNSKDLYRYMYSNPINYPA